MKTSLRRRVSGASLLEILIVIAAVGLIGALATLRVDLKESASRSSAISSVETLNSAVKVYLANGGEIVANSDIFEVVRKLKTVRQNSQSDQLGLRGPFIDTRIGVIQEGAPKWGIIWNDSKKSFVVSDADDRYRIFYSEDVATVEEEVRSDALAYGSDWVWSYSDENMAPVILSPTPVNLTPADPADPDPLEIDIPEEETPPDPLFLTAAVDVVTVSEDFSTTYNILANDINETGAAIHLHSFQQQGFSGQVFNANGGASMVVNSSGELVVDPSGLYEQLGSEDVVDDYFFYEINDSAGESAVGIVLLKIQGVNDLPEVINDSYILPDSNAVNFDLLHNDTDKEGELEITHINGEPIEIGQPIDIQGVGIVSLNGDGTLNFDPSGTSGSSVESIAEDNLPWTYPQISAPNSNELYDSRALRFLNSEGRSLKDNRIAFQLDIAGTYDDSIAIDLDGDGTIDYAVTQGDAYATPDVGNGVYRPWVSAAPMSLAVEVTLTGTTVIAIWDGVPLVAGFGGAHDPGHGSGGGIDNVSNMTLADLGFNPDGTIPSDDFTMNSIRVGNLNDDGPSHHGMSFSLDPDLVAAQVRVEFSYTVTDDEGATAEGLVDVSINVE